MKTMTENLFDSFVRMTPSEQKEFMLRVKAYENQIVAYTPKGNPLTRLQYQERVNTGIAQCFSGRGKSLEQVCEDTGNDYDAL